MADEVGPVDAVHRSSLTQEAYNAIRSMITSGDMPPGSRVTVRPLLEKFQLSATPVKAALITLAREGVLESKLHRGFFVPALSPSDMREIYELREALDRLAGRLAAANPSHGSIGRELREKCNLQRRLLEDGDVDAYRRMDIEFHHSLWTLCGNSRLSATGERLMDQMKLGNSLSARLPGRIDKSLSEHLSIVDAIEAGDVKRAGLAAGRHIRSVLQAFNEANEASPEDSVRVQAG